MLYKLGIWSNILMSQTFPKSSVNGRDIKDRRIESINFFLRKNFLSSEERILAIEFIKTLETDNISYYSIDTQYNAETIVLVSWEESVRCASDAPRDIVERFGIWGKDSKTIYPDIRIFMNEKVTDSNKLTKFTLVAFQYSK